jgi:outer membrane assembly lipoprotein YfiO
MTVRSCLAIALLSLTAPALAQPAADPAPGAPASPTPPAPSTDPRAPLVLDAGGQWVQAAPEDTGPDATLMAQVRELIAAGQFAEAKAKLDPWITANARGESPYLPQGYLLRGDAISAGGDEYQALYDYESLIRQFPGSPEFVKAVERELEIATAYVRGMKRKWLGMRFIDATDAGVELLIRVQERMPGSRLAEQAGIELADHYYRNHDLSLAADAYELFLKNYPNSAYRNKALQRQVYSNIGRFKGPAYDGSALLDSRVLIRRYMALYPASAEEAGLDEALLARIDESAGQQQLEVANWYLRRGDAVAARLTMRRLLKSHPQSAAAGQALKIMEAQGWIKLDRGGPPAAPVAEPPPEPAPAPAPDTSGETR